MKNAIQSLQLIKAYLMAPAYLKPVYVGRLIAPIVARKAIGKASLFDLLILRFAGNKIKSTGRKLFA